MDTKIQTSGGLHGGVDLETGVFEVTQDATPFIEQAKRDREASLKHGRDVGYKKACTIPDIVAVDLLYKYGIDVHDPNFMHDPAQVRRVIGIIKSEYPLLMSY